MEIDMAAPTPAPGTLAPTYPAFKEMTAPATMDFAERVLTVTTTYPNGHVYFNGTMLCNVGRQYNTEKAHDGVEKKVSIWSNANTGLLEKVVAKINEQPIRGKLVETNFPPIGPLSIDDVIDTSNSKKKSGDMALRGTFVHIALFPALSRYVSIDFAVHTDALLSRMFTGDYSVLADVIDICDNYNGTTTSKMAIDMDEVRAARAEPAPMDIDMVDRVASLVQRTMMDVVEQNSELVRKNMHLVEQNSELTFKYANLITKYDEALHQALAVTKNLFQEPYPQRALALPPYIMPDDSCADTEYGRTLVKHTMDDMAKILAPWLREMDVPDIQLHIGRLVDIDEDMCRRLRIHRKTSVTYLTAIYGACKIRWSLRNATHLTWRQFYMVVARFNELASGAGTEVLESRARDLCVRFGFDRV